MGIDFCTTGLTYPAGFEEEIQAAEAYDVVAIKCNHTNPKKVKTNYDVDRYADFLTKAGSWNLQELIMAVRRKSQSFSGGTSSYRGVTHHPTGRWEARVGLPGTHKHIYLGLFCEEAEAARAYDRSMVRLHGSGAATNFPLSDYTGDMADHHLMQKVRPPGGVLHAEGWLTC
eukprot:jgi/Astpho2/8473/e_gw1.00124.8.1_t